jgi:hypothetical protein
MPAVAQPRADRSILFSPWAGAVALYVGLTLLYAWPLLGSIGSALPSDIGDPGLNTWILWWNAHAMPLSARWWNAPIFFPVTGAFALSETLLGVTPLTTPLQWAGASPVVAYNVAYLLSFPTAAIAAHALARRLTGRHDAALIAGLAFGFSPYRAAQMPHLQMLWSCWMPLALLALHRYIEEHRRRDLVLLAVCWLLNGLTCGYYLFFFGIFVGLWGLWFVRTTRDAAVIGVTLVMASLPLAPLLMHYQHVQDAFGLTRGFAEIELFGADASAIWASSRFNWLPAHWTFVPRAEGELYPGVTILLLTIIGVVAAWRAQPAQRLSRTQAVLLIVAGAAFTVSFLARLTGGWHLVIAGVSLTTTRAYKPLTVGLYFTAAAILRDRRVAAIWRRRSAFAFFAAAAFVLFVLALGPVAKVFGTRFLYRAPYSWLMSLPGGHSLRVPARLAMLVCLCLGQGAAIAFTRFTRQGAPRVFVAALALAIGLDGWVFAFKTAPVPAAIDLSGLDPRAAVLELPMADVYQDTRAMLRSIQHGHPIINGFSGYGPPHYDVLQSGVRAFDDSVLVALGEMTPLVVVVNRDQDADGRYRDFMNREVSAVRVRDILAATIYTLPMRARAPTGEPDHPLTITSIAVSSGEDTRPAMTDLDPRTRWTTPKPQHSGDHVTLTISQSGVLSRLEMDLGRFHGDYPRRLRVSVIDGDHAPMTVWEGSTAGLALQAALVDPAMTPLTIDLPPGTHGHTIVLTLLADELKMSWSIAEIKLFGR